MGCTTSRHDGEMLTLTMPASLPTAASVKTFATIEEADEKAGHGKQAALASTILGEMGVGVGALKPAKSQAEQIDDFHRELRRLPATTDPDLVDADVLSPALAAELLERLLEPDCPSPVVSKRLCFRVLLAAIDALRDAGPVVDVPLPTGGERQIIVGDTHGQLQDVLTIMTTHGAPSASNRYIFNGDIADRGPHAVEIFMLALLHQLTTPK